MSSPRGLAQEQSEKLAGLQVGDLVMVQKWPITHQHVGSDGGDDEDEDAGDLSDPEDESGDEGAGSGDDSVDGEEGDGDGAEQSEEQESDGDADSEIGAEYDEDDEDDDAVETTLYKVHAITKDAAGAVSDVTVYRLTYTLKLANAVATSFSIYGTEIVPSNTVPVNKDAFELITGITNDESMTFTLCVNPTGDELREAMFGRYCPASCDEGYLPTQQEMHEMVSDNITTIAEHRPVCPVCNGRDLMLEYQALRERLFTGTAVHNLLGDAFEFFTRLNPRRSLLGYEFRQFDEREWGYLFDDMIDEDMENGTDNNGDGWENPAAEAMDPSANIVQHPASATAIAALPRMTFAEAKEVKGEAAGSGECLICREDFAEGTVVVEMPCGHLFCANGCIELWLKQFNSCPTCREKVPADGEEKADGGEEDGVEGESGEREGGEEVVGGEENGEHLDW